MNHYHCLFVLFILVIALVSSNTTVDHTFSFTTVDGRTHSFNFIHTNASDCLYTEENRSAHVACMYNYPYSDVASTWKDRGFDLEYVSVNCKLQSSIPRHSHYCICKTKYSHPYFLCHINKLYMNIFRSTGNVQVLDIAYNQIGEIAQRSFYGLVRVKFISLRGNQISDLPYGIFCDTASLEYLDLSELELDVFPSHCFKCGNNTSKLKAIDISNSKVRDVPKGSLLALSRIESLNLGSNKIGALHSNSFEGASSLMDLNVSDNALENLFPDFCDVMPKLRTLHLRNNEFRSFYFDQIGKCSFIKTLDISTNNISSLRGSLSNLTRLEYLNLSVNILESFDMDMNSLNNLTYFDMSHNHLNRLNEEKIGGLKSLLELNLSYNRLNMSENFPQVFETLESLNILDMQHNKLRRIPKSSFVNLNNLVKLYINDNEVSTLYNNSFLGLENLRELHLQNNALVGLPAAILKPLASLEFISLTNNRLVTLSLDGWPSALEFLYLNGNQLKSVPGNIDYTRIKILDFSDNLLHTFDTEGKALTAVERLDLSGNKLSILNETTFSSMPNLQSLSLDRNELSLKLTSSSFRGALKLKSLDLSGNRIEEIENIFTATSLNSLETLNISRNPITDIKQLSTNFYGSRIKEIDISNCNIAAIERDTFANLTNLTTVNLNDNNIRTFEPFDASVDTSFDFTGNPIICSCHIVWLKDPYVEIEGKRIPSQNYKVPRCSAYTVEGIFSPQLLRRDQYLCKETSGCDSNCKCFKREQHSDILLIMCRFNLSAAPAIIPQSALTVFLDGNNFINDSLQAFSEFTNMTAREIYLNRSALVSVDPWMLEGFNYLEIISFAGNKLTTIPSTLVSNLTTLKQLHLQDNYLSEFDAGVFVGLDSLQELDISGNNFKHLDAGSTSELASLPSIKYFFLARNSWRCDCYNKAFKDFLDKVRYKISDRRQLVCNGQEMMYVPKSAFSCVTYNKPESNKVGKTTIIAICCVLVALIICSVCIYFRRECVSVIYSVTGLHIPPRRRYLSGKPFDVFVGYDPTDQHSSEYVQIKLWPKLRRSHYNCQTSNDVIQDADVTKKAIEDSKCSVFVINKNFATNSFLVKLFHIATDYSRKGHHKVILLIHGDIDILTLEPEIVTRLRRGDYITARSRLWWKRLKYELPLSIKSQEDDGSETDTIIFSAISDEGYYNSMTDA